MTEIITIKAPTLRNIPIMETREIGREIMYRKAIKNLYIQKSSTDRQMAVG